MNDKPKLSRAKMRTRCYKCGQKLMFSEDFYPDDEIAKHIKREH